MRALDKNSNRFAVSILVEDNETNSPIVAEAFNTNSLRLVRLKLNEIRQQLYSLEKLHSEGGENL